MDNYEAKVRHQIEKIKSCSCREIEAEVAKKRIAWCQQHAIDSGEKYAPTPREAFAMLFFDYMGLSEGDLPVVSETGEKITWLSKNPFGKSRIRIGVKEIVEKSPTMIEVIGNVLKNECISLYR